MQTTIRWSSRPFKPTRIFSPGQQDSTYHQEKNAKHDSVDVDEDTMKVVDKTDDEEVAVDDLEEEDHGEENDEEVAEDLWLDGEEEDTEEETSDYEEIEKNKRSKKKKTIQSISWDNGIIIIVKVKVVVQDGHYSPKGLIVVDWQDNFLLSNDLTVWETIEFAARLKTPSSSSLLLSSQSTSNNTVVQIITIIIITAVTFPNWSLITRWRTWNKQWRREKSIQSTRISNTTIITIPRPPVNGNNFCPLWSWKRLSVFI